MKYWKYYVFVCVVFGFLYIGSIQIHAEEVTQPEAVEQTETEAPVSTTDVSTSDTADTQSISDDQQDIQYTSHIQGDGWETQEHTNGELSGTQGESKRLEAIKINLPDHNDLIQYQVHVQDIGWMDYVSGGEIAGTTGQAKRIEALRIRLLGDLANTYNVIYRTHVQNYGWLKWVMNDTISGTTGQSLRIEAIEILLAKKDVEAASGNNVVYDSHVQNIGWQSRVQNGQIAGSVGKSYRLEAVHIFLSNQTIDGDIQYQTHIQNLGWQDWKTDGQLSGTTGQSLRLEAIRIRLTGSISQYYDIYYRVYVQDYGWLAWTCDGKIAGTTGLSKRLEAIEIILVQNISNKPSSSSTISYFDHQTAKNYVQTMVGFQFVNDGNSQVFCDSNGDLVMPSYQLGNTKYIMNSSGIIIQKKTSTSEISSVVKHWGVDISQFNGSDFDVTPYDFVLIRSNYGTTTDPLLETYVNACIQAGIPYGFYCYSYALSVDDAHTEAAYTLALANQYKPTLGIWYDMEDADNYKTNRGVWTKDATLSFCQTFCKDVKSMGWYTGIYSSSWFIQNWYNTGLEDYDKWVAQWDANDGQYHSDTHTLGSIHQYTSVDDKYPNGLDKNAMYVDFDYYTLV